MQSRLFLVFVPLVFLCCSRREQQSCDVDTGAPLSKQPNSNGFELAEISGTWKLDSLVQQTTDSTITVKAPFQAYHFRAGGSFSFIDGNASEPKEHTYGKLILKGREMYVVDQPEETSRQALYHWEILQLTKDRMKLRDFMVEEVANVKGDLYLTRIPDLKTVQE